MLTPSNTYHTGNGAPSEGLERRAVPLTVF